MKEKTMPVPDYQTIMKPLLEFLADKKARKVKECTQYIENYFKLTPEEKKQKLPSGNQRTVTNRVGWAKMYLNKAGLIGQNYKKGTGSAGYKTRQDFHTRIKTVRRV
jgi:restriction system protein